MNRIVVVEGLKKRSQKLPNAFVKWVVFRSFELMQGWLFFDSLVDWWLCWGTYGGLDLSLVRIEMTSAWGALAIAAESPQRRFGSEDLLISLLAFLREFVNAETLYRGMFQHLKRIARPKAL